MIKQFSEQKLSAEDQDLVNIATNIGFNATERDDFHPWIMIMYLSGIIVALGVIARLLGYYYLP